MASFEIYRWLSTMSAIRKAYEVTSLPEVMNFVHGLRLYLPNISSNWESRSRSYRSKLTISSCSMRERMDVLCKELVCTENFGNLDQLIGIIVTMEESSHQLWLVETVLSSLRFLAEDLPVSWCPAKKGRKSLPCWQTYTPDSTCPDCNRIPGSPPVIPVLWNT